MITVAIVYRGNHSALSQLLVGLQPQLHPNDDIYIFDLSRDRSAIRVAKRYGSTRCYLFVELMSTQSKIFDFAIQSMSDNKQDGVLFLPSTSVISNTFVANLKKASKDYDVLFFNSSFVEDMDPNFKWFTPPPTVSKLENAITPTHLSTAVYFSSAGRKKNLFETNLNVGFIESELMLIQPDY